MKKKCLVVVLMLAMVFTCIACGKNDSAVEDPVTPENENLQGSIMDNYNQLLGSTTNIDDLYGFADENIMNATPEEADQIANGIFGYGDQGTIDYTRLATYSDYYSPEMKSYLNLMSTEQTNPSMNEDGIQISLSDLLNRSEMFEQHLTNYPGGITENRAYEQYYQLVNAAVTGGYDGTDDLSYYYRNTDDSSIVDGHAYDAYHNFVSERETGYTSDILKDYVAILDNNSKSFDDDVKTFFTELGDRIRGIRE